MELLTDTSMDEGGELAPESIDPENYAALPEVQSLVRDEIIGQMQGIRDDKRTYMQRVVRFWQVWQGIHNKLLYRGRADLYWRLGYKIVETFINHVKPQVFPSNTSFYIEPDPYDPISMLNAPVARRLIKHDVEHAQVEAQMDEVLRDGLVAGCSIVKHPWMVRKTRNYSRKLLSMPPGAMLGPSSFGATDPRAHALPMFDGSLTQMEGPGFIPVNLADFFIHPITARDINDADFVWEDVTMPEVYFISMLKRGKFDPAATIQALEQEAGKGIVTDTADIKDALNERQAITEAEVMRKRKHARVMQEIWGRLDLYGTGEEVDCKIVLLGDHILEVRQNPYFFQSPPYLAWRAIRLKNFFFGAGIVEPIEHLNIAANAMGNQMLDAIALQINHILGVNVAMLAQDVSSLRISPRAIWPALGNPDEVFKEFRPTDNTPTALAGLQLLAGVMQDIAGAPPIMQGKQSSKDGTTAAEIHATSLGAAAGVRTMVRNFEVELMSPWIQRAWKAEQQMRAKEGAARVGMFKVRPQEVAADMGMRWMVSSMVPPMVAQGQEMQEGVNAAQMGQPMAPGQPPIGSLPPGNPAGGGGLGNNPALGL